MVCYYIDQARKALVRRDILGALEVLRAATAEAEMDAALLADMLIALCQGEAAGAVLEVAAAASGMFPDSAALLLVQSEAAAARGEIDSAILLARRSLILPDQRGMEIGRTAVVLARHLIKAGRTNEAASELQSCLAERPGGLDVLALLADVRERQGEFSGAAETLLQVAQNLKTAHDPWLRAVRLLLRAGEPERAIHAAEAAREAIGQSHLLAIEWSGALYSCGRFEEAAALCMNALQSRPKIFPLHRQAIFALVAAGRSEAAEVATLAMLRDLPIDENVAFVFGTFANSLEAEARSRFLARARDVSSHPLVGGISADSGASTSQLLRSLRQREGFGVECFPADDLVLELGDAFAEMDSGLATRLRNWAERRRRGQSAPLPIHAFTIPEATLFLRDGLFVIADRDGTPIDLFARRPDPRFIEAATATTECQELGRIFLVEGTGARNYAHWCLDILPQIAAAHFRAPGVAVMIPRLPPSRFIKQSVELFGLGSAAPLSIADGKYRVAELNILSTSVTQTFRRWLQLGNRPYATNLLNRTPAPATIARRRLFVDRPPSQRRTAINRQAVLDLVFDRGFESIDPGTLPVAEQAAAFGAASHVVGLHGAAMTNVAFCRPGTRVLEVHSPDHSLECFAIAAMVRGCVYRPHVAQTLAPGGRLWAHPHDMDFRVDIETLKRDLDQMLGS